MDNAFDFDFVFDFDFDFDFDVPLLLVFGLIWTDAPIRLADCPPNEPNFDDVQPKRDTLEFEADDFEPDVPDVYDEVALCDDVPVFEIALLLIFDFDFDFDFGPDERFGLLDFDLFLPIFDFDFIIFVCVWKQNFEVDSIYVR